MKQERSVLFRQSPINIYYRSRYEWIFVTRVKYSKILFVYSEIEKKKKGKRNFTTPSRIVTQKQRIHVIHRIWLSVKNQRYFYVSLCLTCVFLDLPIILHLPIIPSILPFFLLRIEKMKIWSTLVSSFHLC